MIHKHSVDEWKDRRDSIASIKLQKYILKAVLASLTERLMSDGSTHS